MFVFVERSKLVEGRLGKFNRKTRTFQVWNPFHIHSNAQTSVHTWMLISHWRICFFARANFSIANWKRNSENYWNPWIRLGIETETRITSENMKIKRFFFAPVPLGPFYCFPSQMAILLVVFVVSIWSLMCLNDLLLPLCNELLSFRIYGVFTLEHF